MFQSTWSIILDKVDLVIAKWAQIVPINNTMQYKIKRLIKIMFLTKHSVSFFAAQLELCDHDFY